MKKFARYAASIVVWLFVVVCLDVLCIFLLDPEDRPSTWILNVFGYLAAMATYFLLTSFSANRSVTNLSAAHRDAALASPPPDGCGLVFVHRSGMNGWAVGYDVVLDDMTVAQLKSPRFTRLVVPAGQHVLRTEHRNDSKALKVIPGELAFTLAPGETAIFGIKTVIGMRGGLQPFREPDTAELLRKFANTTMVAPDAVPTPVAVPGRVLA